MKLHAINLSRPLSAALICTMLGISACSTMPSLGGQNKVDVNSSNPVKILTDSRWEQIQPVDSASPDINPALRPAIQLDANTKRFSGNDGCNRIMGSYQADMTSLKFGQMASTKMACIGGNEAASRNFTDALSRTASYRFESNYLILLDAAGDKLLTLRKAGSPETK